MTNYEKWKSERGYKEPSKFQIICMNAGGCENCPIYKKFRICEDDNGEMERVIEEWLNQEVDE